MILQQFLNHTTTLFSIHIAASSKKWEERLFYL